jgi:hypothetical protein
MRIVLDIEKGNNDLLATKEAIAMALEQFGNVRVVSITTDRSDKR